jgi:hypothetical protein
VLPLAGFIPVLLLSSNATAAWFAGPQVLVEHDSGVRLAELPPVLPLAELIPSLFLLSNGLLPRRCL